MRLQVNFKHLRLYFYLVNPTQTLYTKHLGPVIFIHVMDWGMCSCTSHFSPEMADKWLVLWTVGNNWLDLEIEQLHTWPVTVWIDIKLMLNKFINMSYLACFWVTKGMVNRKFMKKNTTNNQNHQSRPKKLLQHNLYLGRETASPI